MGRPLGSGNREGVGAGGVVIEGSGIEDMEFFGEPDIVNGKIGSEMPAWYFEPNIRRVSDKVNELERSLADDNIHDKSRPAKRIELKKHKDRLQKIEASRPKVDDRKLDALSKIRKSLRSKIAETMPSQSQMMRGTANANEEMQRAMQPCIAIEGDEVLFAKKCGMRIHEKRGEALVSRNDATRLWKLAGRLLDEDTNIESIRKA